MWNHSTSKPRWDATEPATICFRPRIWTWQFKHDGFGSRFVTRPPQFKWRKRNSRKSKILPLPKIVQFRQRSDWNSVTSLLQSGTGLADMQERQTHWHSVTGRMPHSPAATDHCSEGPLYNKGIYNTWMVSRSDESDAQEVTRWEDGEARV